MKLTPWFDRKKRPVHTGVYKVRPPRWIEGVYAYWNGKWWGDCAYTPQWAERYIGPISFARAIERAHGIGSDA